MFVAYLIGLVLAAHRAGQLDDAALVAGYLSTDGEDLGVAGTTLEFAAGGSLARSRRSVPLAPTSAAAP